MPIRLIVSSTFGLSLFLLIISRRIKRSLPPSRAGIGRRFMTARFALSMMQRFKRTRKALKSP